MLEIDIELNPGQVGGLLNLLMQTWPGIEFETTLEGLRFYLEETKNIDAQLINLEKSLQDFEKVRQIEELIPISIQNLAGPDSRKPLIALGRFLITPLDHEVRLEEGQAHIILIPSHVFGTGGHPSTDLTLAALEEFYTPQPGQPDRTLARVLDVGTGSGILALAAARLGAGPVLAVDSNPEAIRAARSNIEANKLTGRIRLKKASLAKLSGEFDLILANLVPSVLTKSGRALENLLAPEGTLIAAGFTDAQTPGILKGISKTGLTMSKSYSRDGWSALALTRNQKRYVPR